MAWRNRVEVSYSALRQNVAVVKSLLGDRTLVAVGKADAYGLGLERCSRIYHEGGAGLIAVATVGEADRVRKAVPKARILVLGSPLPEERQAAVASGYEVSCSSLVEIHEYAHLAERCPGVGIHITIDTGMGRAGDLPERAPKLVEEVLHAGNLRLAGITTHFAMAMDPEATADQGRRFQDALDACGPLPANTLIHCANSEAVLTHKPLLGNAVRCGLLLTGVVPEGCSDPGLVEAVRWVSALILVKDLPKGHTISYNRTHVLRRDSRVALVPVGYADGYPLACSGKGQVLVQGRRVPILGRVTMDYLVIDCSDLPRPPVVGDQVILLGQDGNERIGVQELATCAGTIPYDILCGLRGRCEVVGVH